MKLLNKILAHQTDNFFIVKIQRILMRMFAVNKLIIISKEKNDVGKVNYNNFGSNLGNITYTDLLLSL